MNKSISQNVALVFKLLHKYTANILLSEFEPNNKIRLQSTLSPQMVTQESQSISCLLYVQQIQISNSLNGNDLLQQLFGDKQ